MEKKGLAWKWTFESIFDEHKTTKVKCEFRYGTIFGYLEKVRHKDKGTLYRGLCTVTSTFTDSHLD